MEPDQANPVITAGAGVAAEAPIVQLAADEVLLGDEVIKKPVSKTPADQLTRPDQGRPVNLTAQPPLGTLCSIGSVVVVRKPKDKNDGKSGAIVRFAHPSVIITINGEDLEFSSEEVELVK